MAKKFFLYLFVIMLVIGGVLDYFSLRNQKETGTVVSVVLDTNWVATLSGGGEKISANALGGGPFRVVVNDTVLEGERFAGNYEIDQGEISPGELTILNGDMITVDIFSDVPVTVFSVATSGNILWTTLGTLGIIVLIELLAYMFYSMAR